MHSQDNAPTSVIPRIPSGTGQFPAIGSERLVTAGRTFPHRPAAWRLASDVALVLAFLTLATGAFVLARVWIILVAWR